MLTVRRIGSWMGFVRVSYRGSFLRLGFCSFECFCLGWVRWKNLFHVLDYVHLNGLLGKGSRISRWFQPYSSTTMLSLVFKSPLYRRSKEARGSFPVTLRVRLRDRGLPWLLCTLLEPSCKSFVRPAQRVILFLCTKNVCRNVSIHHCTEHDVCIKTIYKSLSLLRLALPKNYLAVSKAHRSPLRTVQRTLVSLPLPQPLPS